MSEHCYTTAREPKNKPLRVSTQQVTASAMAWNRTRVVSGAPLAAITLHGCRECR
jgi:hypothetical protein